MSNSNGDVAMSASKDDAHPDDVALAAAADGVPGPALADHLARCAACAARLSGLRALGDALAAIALPTPDPRASDALLARLARRRSWRPAITGALIGAAAMAVAFVATRPPAPASPAEPPSGFTARGAGTSRSVEVTPLVAVAAGAPSRPLTPGDALGPEAVLSYRAIKRGPGARWLMVYGCDARGEVHWVTPDWQDPATDPSGVALTADDAVHEPATGLAPEAPAGPFKLVALTTSAPITVRRVEALGRAACDPAALSSLPDAEVAATPLMVPTR